MILKGTAKPNQLLKGSINRVQFVYKNTSTGSAPVRLVSVDLPASAWEGGDNLYSQVVAIGGITKNSQVKLTPSPEQLVIFYEKDITFVTENDGGVVTVYVIGQKPANDYTIQANVVEVSA